MTVANWTRENLEQLIGQEETSSLEFKRSDALSNTEPHKKELVKDVTALANAAGGIIVYGIVERNGTATEIDEGCNVAPEWIEQVLESNAEPKVAGVVVQRIPLSEGRYAFAIEVPQATSLAPHQSKQHYQYFRRYGRKSLPMLDHEVRDLMRRGSVPDLYFKATLRHLRDDEFVIRFLICNRSPTPAEYGSATITVSNSINVRPGSNENHLSTAELMVDGRPVPAQSLTRVFGRNNHHPVFREMDWVWMEAVVTIQRRTSHAFAYSIACPGCTAGETGWLIRLDVDDAQVHWPARD